MLFADAHSISISQSALDDETSQCSLQCEIVSQITLGTRCYVELRSTAVESLRLSTLSRRLRITIINRSLFK